MRIKIALLVLLFIISLLAALQTIDRPRGLKDNVETQNTIWYNAMTTEDNTDTIAFENTVDIDTMIVDIDNGVLYIELR